MELEVVWKPYYFSCVKLKDCVDKCYDEVLWLFIVNKNLERINSKITSHIFVAIIVPFSCFRIRCVNVTTISIPPFNQTWLTIVWLLRDISGFFEFQHQIGDVQPSSDTFPDRLSHKSLFYLRHHNR